MLHGWVKSEERIRIYHQLLAHFQDPSTFDELVLSLAALLLLYRISQDARPPESSRKASLTNLDHFFHGHFSIEESYSLLTSTLWTFLRILTSEAESTTTNALIQLLDYVAELPNPLPPAVDQTLEKYWMRVHSQLTHNEAMAQVQERTEPLLRPVGDKSPGEDADEKEDDRFSWKDFCCVPGNCGVPVHAPQFEGPWCGTALKALGMGEMGWGVWGGRTGRSPWSQLD